MASVYDRGKCRGKRIDGADPFFDVLVDGNRPRKDSPHLALRDETCARCPVRRPCLEDAMEFEGDSGVTRRFGVWAAMTPAQRHALNERGWWRCPQCAETLDPMALITGELECDCGWEETLPPLSENGVAWKQHHADLAELVVVWLVENVEVGGRVPTPTALHAILGVRKHNLRRVYEFLVHDGTLVKTDGGYRRQAATPVLLRWRPPAA